VLVVTYLKKQNVLTKLCEQVRFARKRFGRYEFVDFLAVLFGYAISGERTLEEFYESLQPFAVPFMALFERDRLPSRSALSRFLAALSPAPVEALRTLFLNDLLSRPLTPDKQTGGLVDRAGNTWIAFDIDGTREAARQRALPLTDELPPPFRRLDDVCAPGYTGRKRGEVVRTRTTVAQAHSYRLYRLVWQPWEWAISRRTAQGPCRHWSVSSSVSVAAGTGSAAARRSIWHRGGAL